MMEPIDWYTWTLIQHHLNFVLIVLYTNSNIDSIKIMVTLYNDGTHWLPYI